MPQREYDITITPDGTVEVVTHGFKGKRCLDAAKVFAEIVGELTSVQHTQEYYAPDEPVSLHQERHR